MKADRPERMFILYDGRAKGGDTDEAAVLDLASSEAEARRLSWEDWKGFDAIWYESKLARQVGPEYEEVGPRPDLGTGALL